MNTFALDDVIALGDVSTETMGGFGDTRDPDLIGVFTQTQM